ncbi:MAG: ATPase, partial [Sphingomonas oligoaromativorans]
MERIGLIAIMGALAVICGLALAIASAGDAVVLLAGILAGVGLTLLLTAARRWSRGDLEPEEEPAIQPVPAPTPGVDDLLGAL